MNLDKSHNPKRMIKWNGKYLARCSNAELIECILTLIKLISDTQNDQMKKDSSIKVFVDGKETVNFQQIGSAISVQAPIKQGWFWNLISKVPILKNFSYKPQWLVSAIYEYAGEEKQPEAANHQPVTS